MAKIENTTVYPLVTPTASDYVIGTNTSDDNRTVSFSIADIAASGALQDLQSVLNTPTTNAGGTATGDISLTGNITVNGDIYPTQILAGGAPGSAGQILSSTGTGIQWIAAAGAQDLQDVIAVDSNTTLGFVMDNCDIDTTGSINMSGASQGLTLLNSSEISLGANCRIITDDDIRLNLGTCVLDFNYGASISDGNNVEGTAGQIFTRGAAGVEWSTGIPAASMPTLQEVLNAGNTANLIGMAFTGVSNTTFSANSTIQSFASNVWSGTNGFSSNGATPATSGINLTGSLSDGVSTGTASQVLTSTATGVSWADLSTVGVSSVSATVPIAAAFPADPITISPTTGAVVVRQNIYAGGSLIGCVPAGGTAGAFLEGNGNWTTPTGAVTSVSVLASAASTTPSDAIKISPTTGAVQVQSNYFAGSDNVGHVPDSSAAAQTTTFLRADGTWAAAGGSAAPEGYLPYLLGVAKTSFTAGNYHTLASNNTSTGGDRTVFTTDLGSSSPEVMAGTMSDKEHIAGCFLYNPRTNACTSAFPNMKVCDFEMQFLSEFGPHSWNVELWKTNQCSTGTYTLAGSFLFSTVVADTLYCGTIGWVSSALQTLSPGEAFFITLRTTGTLTAADVTLNIVARWQGAA